MIIVLATDYHSVTVANVVARFSSPICQTDLVSVNRHLRYPRHRARANMAMKMGASTLPMSIMRLKIA